MLKRIRYQEPPVVRRRGEKVGLATSAVLVGLGYVYGGFVPYWCLILLPLVIAGTGTAFYLAARRTASVRPGERFAAGRRAAAAWLALVPVPFVLRWVWLAIELAMIPRPPGAGAYSSTDVNPMLRYGGGRTYYYSVMSDRGSDELYEFYVDRLAWQGWRPGPRPPWYRQIPGHLQTHAFVRGFETMHLALYEDSDDEGRTNIVITGQDPPLSPWLRDLFRWTRPGPKAPKPAAP